jgi:heme/copper-type cytochrome/quinol oxidase subunit 3
MSQPSEERPLGMMAPVPAGVEIPPESPDVGARALAVAARLLAGATTFFFLAFLFAYFYLRSLNVAHMWRPGHVDPRSGLGVAFVVCLLLSAGLAILAGRGMNTRNPRWVLAAGASVLLGLAAVAVQCVEYTVQKFGPTDGAFASVFCVWTAMYLIAVLFTMYWLETQVASEIRARREPAGPHGDIRDADRLIAPGLAAAVFYWSYLAGIGVITYVVLYLL